MNKLKGIGTLDRLISDFRHGRSVLLVSDNGAGEPTGVVAVAAEYCKAQHITFMARQARGLVCLALTQERCETLRLPPMVGTREQGAFTLSIEAAQGIETGISAADRALTIQVAVAPDSIAEDLVQPGHVFPVCVAEGGVLTRTGAAEAAVDLSRIAGLTEASVFTEVLDAEGEVASGHQLYQFAKIHHLTVGSVSELVHFRLSNERTVECIQSGQIETAHGELTLSVYREQTEQRVHLALHKGVIRANRPTLVRVHSVSTLRDLIGTRLKGRLSWRFDESLEAVTQAAAGVLVVLSKPESVEDLLDTVTQLIEGDDGAVKDDNQSYSDVGMGAQILSDLGVGQIHLLGPPLKYNALAGFGLEVVEFLGPGNAHR